MTTCFTLLIPRFRVVAPMWVGLVAIFVILPTAAQAQRDSRQVVTLYAQLNGGRVSLGSGFVVEPGIIATAYHVVEGATAIDVGVPGARLTRVSGVRAIAPRLDIALLKVSALASVAPLILTSTLPATDATLKMVGAAAGISGSVYRANLAHARAIPLTAFADSTGRTIYPGMDDVLVLHVGGIIYNGLSGGPLLDQSDKVLGVVCGSLNVGGSAGWAIPSSGIERLLNSPDLASPVNSFSWPRGLRSASSRSLAYIRTIDQRVASTVDDFTALSARLAELNQQISIDTLSATSALISFSSSISAYQMTAQATADGPLPWTIDNLNQSLSNNDPQSVMKVRALLAERFLLDRKLRAVVARLEQAANDPQLDSASILRVQRAADRIKSSQPAIAATTFEQIKGIDRNTLLQSIDKVGLKMNGPFGNLGDALDYMHKADHIRDQLNQYSILNDWFFKEQAYFSDAAAFIRQYRGVVVFVPQI